MNRVEVGILLCGVIPIVVALFMYRLWEGQYRDVRREGLIFGVSVSSFIILSMAVFANWTRIVKMLQKKQEVNALLVRV
jgi:hypothetical protein